MLTNYPNPFNPVTTFQYWNPADGLVVLRIVDMLGRVVGNVAEEHQQAGLHTVRFDGGRMASGVYLCRLETAAGSAVRRVVLMR